MTQLTITNNFHDEPDRLERMTAPLMVNGENRFYVDVGRARPNRASDGVLQMVWYHYWWYDSHHHPWWWYGAYYWWWWRYNWSDLRWVWWWDWFWVWWHWHHWWSWSTWWGDLNSHPINVLSGSGRSGGSGASGSGSGAGTTASTGGPLTGGIPPVIATPGGSLGSPSPPPAAYSPGHDVRYLIDGVTVYKRTSELLKDVADHGGDGYVHMRFWECDPDTELEAGVKFRDRIAEVAHAGNEVRLILWKPSWEERKAGLRNEFDTNERAKKILESIDPVHIKIELVEHALYDGSLHTKTMIFSNGDGIRAIVGGLNMTNQYRDAPPARHTTTLARRCRRNCRHCGLRHRKRLRQSLAQRRRELEARDTAAPGRADVREERHDENREPRCPVGVARED